MSSQRKFSSDVHETFNHWVNLTAQLWLSLAKPYSAQLCQLYQYQEFYFYFPLKKMEFLHRSLEYIDWARAEFTCSDLSCLDERLGDFEKFPLPWLGEAHSTSHLGNQANRARSPRLSS